MKAIVVFALEKVETRYTAEWFEGVPKEIARTASEKFGEGRVRLHLGQTAEAVLGHAIETLSSKRAWRDFDCVVINLPGKMPVQTASSGAFLNFTSTNTWKSTQLEAFCSLVPYLPQDTTILFTDAWNPAIINVRYISDLENKDWKMAAIWHAGVHDQWDFLGRIIPKKHPEDGQNNWAMLFEKGIFQALDKNVFTTDFYRDHFSKVMGFDRNHPKFMRSGHPNQELLHLLKPVPVWDKEPIILFPHRIAPEKQLEIFKDLETQLPDFQFIVAQEKQLSKKEYRELMSKSLVSYSAALQETHGIAQVEAILCSTMPVSPNRLSYTEMYNEWFLYSSEWTESAESYQRYRPQMANFLKNLISTFRMMPQYMESIMAANREKLIETYITSKPLMEYLVSTPDNVGSPV